MCLNAAGKAIVPTILERDVPAGGAVLSDPSSHKVKTVNNERLHTSILFILIFSGILVLVALILGAWRLFEWKIKRSMEQEGGGEGLATGIEGSSSDDDDDTGRGNWEELVR